MGFETQEEAERWAENMEFMAGQRKEERMLNPRLSAWLAVADLPAYKELAKPVQELLKGIFDYAWERAESTVLRERIA